MDEERGTAFGLDEERKPVDPEGTPDEIGKTVAQKPRHTRRSGFRDRAGQGHVKTELIEDVRITPAHQVFTLLRGQTVRLSPLQVCFRERRAKRLETFDHPGCELLQRLMRCLGNQSKEWSDLLDGDRGDVERCSFLRECGKGGQQICLACTIREKKGCLQRRMKAVAPRIGREFVQFFHREVVLYRPGIEFPGEGIAT